MSAIEKALRQIDGRAGGTNPFADQGRSGMAMPSPLPPSSGLRWTLSVLALSGAAGLAWYATTHWPAVAIPTALKPAPAGPAPVSPAPAASAADAPPAPPVAAPAAMPPAADPAAPAGPADAGGPPPWLAMGGQAWVGGLRNEAALLWMTGLRNLSPTTIALRVGRQQTLAQAESLYARWAGQLPLVVLREYGPEPGRWTVLALPAPVGLDQAHAALRQAHGEAVQWGTVAHWISALASEPGQEPWPASPAAPAAASVSSAPPLPSPPARAVAADGAARPTVVSAPPARVATASAPLPRPVLATPTPVPAPAPLPELSQSQQAALDETRAAPVAARAIEADYERVEQQLARGEHEPALEGVLKLERGIGANWRTRYLAGVAYSGLGRWEEARDALGSAQLKNSGHARIPLYLSVAQQERGDHTAALDTLNKALANHPSMAELWLNKGHSLQAMGRSEEGNAAYARFMEFSAHRSDLQAQRAWVHHRIARLK